MSAPRPALALSEPSAAPDAAPNTAALPARLVVVVPQAETLRMTPICPAMAWRPGRWTS